MAGGVLVSGVERGYKRGCEREASPLLARDRLRQLLGGSSLFPIKEEQLLSGECWEEKEDDTPW